MGNLRALTAFGAREAAVVSVGKLSITERVDLAVASVAARRGQNLALAGKLAGLPLPGPARYETGVPYAVFWVAPEMWFVEAPFASHELIADLLKAALGDAASITEQTDAWVILDLAAPDLAVVLERLCNVDFRELATGYASRTVIEHLGVYLIKQGADAARIYGPRSSAQSLLHALEAAAGGVW